MKYILSYGGGLNSTALLVYLVKNGLPLDAVLFADTGDEYEHTYETVHYYKKWLRAQHPNVIFQVVRSRYNKTLYQYCYDKRIVPSRMTRDCTDKFKIQPMRRWLMKQWPSEYFTRYIGIDYSEAHRMRDAIRKNETNVYPLVEAKIGRQGCKDLLRSYKLPIPHKSGCFYCPFTKRRDWYTMAMNRPDLFGRALALEQNHRHYPRPVSLLRDIPLQQVLDKAEGQTTLDGGEHNCDVAGSCFL